MSSGERNKIAGGQIKTSYERYLFARQKELILELIVPHAGERILCIGNVDGNYLQIFRDKWCSVTGLASSAEIVASIRKKMGEGIELHLRNAEDLPFSDDEFDVVVIVNALESARDPKKVIAEAIRVCRGRVFIGFLNKYSLTGTRQKLKKLFGSTNGEKNRFFSIEEIKEMVRSLIDVETKWGSVIFFPPAVYNMAAELEELVPHMKNPLGAFIGITFPVKYIYRTIQKPVKTYPLKAGTRVATSEAVRIVEL
jgi:SAM-dependent methyltransferase